MSGRIYSEGTYYPIILVLNEGFNQSIFLQKPSSPAAQLFCEDDWRVLNSISNHKRNDCGFIRELLNILYRSEIDKLPFRCLTGCREGILTRNGINFFRERKEAISPKKRLTINQVFRSRIHELEITTEEKLDRVGQSYVNRMIKSAIITLQKVQAAKSEVIEQCINIETLSQK